MMSIIDNNELFRIVETKGFQYFNFDDINCLMSIKNSKLHDLINYIPNADIYYVKNTNNPMFYYKVKSLTRMSFIEDKDILFQFIRFIRKPDQPNSKISDDYLLYEIGKLGRLDIAKYLVEDCQIDIDIKKSEINSKTLLISAAKHNHIDMVKYALDKGADVNATQGLALIYAASKGHYEMVELLLKNNADPEERCSYAFVLACRYGYVNIADILLSYGADPYERDYVAINDAITHGQINILKFLEAKLDLDYNRIIDVGVLQLCILNKDLNMLKFLEGKYNWGDFELYWLTNTINFADSLEIKDYLIGLNFNYNNTNNS